MLKLLIFDTLHLVVIPVWIPLRLHILRNPNAISNFRIVSELAAPWIIFDKTDIELWCLSTLVIVKTERTLRAQALSPEAFNRDRVRGSSVREKKPEAKDRFGKHIKNGIGNDLAINRQQAAAFTQSPDDRIQCPNNQCEAANCSKEFGCSRILGSSGTTTTHGKDPDEDKIGNDRHGIISPFLTLAVSVGSKEASKNQEEVSHYRDNDVGSVQSSQESEVEQQKWRGKSPVDVPSPENLSENLLGSIWDMLVWFLDDDVDEGVPVASGQGKVRQSRKQGNESGQDMEQTFLLPRNVSMCRYGTVRGLTYHGYTQGQTDESEG